jgi:anaerobic ribonucleoside-triphosphate reductase
MFLLEGVNVMDLKIGRNVEKDFWNIVDSVPVEILTIQGLNNLDLFDLADKYLESERVSDVSIDVNANVDGREPVNFQSEIEKPQLKLRSFYILWKKISDLYSRNIADTALRAMLDGSLYFHDITKIDMPYCFAFDTSFLMNYGRPYGWLPSKAPKRSSSFMGQLVEISMDLSQAHAGAC